MKSLSSITVALLFSVFPLIVGYLALGLLPMFLFASGFLGGFVLWLLIPSKASFQAIKAPYLWALGFFVLHKLEERYLGFFPALSKVTGVPVPDQASPLAILLLLSAAIWLFIPFLMKRGYVLGHYAAWTFFASMGITELAHFFLPFFAEEPYGYFPGMVTVLVLAPVAWWGIYRLAKTRPKAG